MALVPTKLVGTTLPTSASDLFTTPTGSTAKVGRIVLSNKTGTDATATILLNGVEIIPGSKVPANGVVALTADQILNSGEKIRGVCSASNAVNAHITGTVIS